MKVFRGLLIAAAALCAAAPAHADFLFTNGSGQTAFDFTCFASKHCFATVITNSAGTEIFTSGSPGSVNLIGSGNTATVSAGGALKVDGSAATQPVSGTVAATQSGAWTVNPTTAASWGIGSSTQNSAAVANGTLILGEFNTSPTTITSGNMSPIQMDSAGNLLVNIKAGAAAGGTSSNFGAAFPSAGTAAGMSQGGNMVALTGTSNNLNVNCQVGCGGSGSISNAGSAVATSSTNIGAVSYNYGFNGTTWDQLLVDGAKQLKVIDGNSAALLTAAQSGTATYGTTNPSSGISHGLDGLSAEQTKVTTGQIVSAMGDLVGKQVTSPYANRENFLNCAVSITGNTATTCTGMGAQGASVKIYVTDLTCTRNDAGTTAIFATLNDGATTIVDLPNNGGGGGFSHTYNVPLQVAANTAFQVTVSASTSTVHCSASGYKGY